MSKDRLLKSFAREIVPPFIFRGARLLVRALSHENANGMKAEPTREKPAEWYDSVYESSAEYNKHYTKSVYYFLWTVVVDRMMRCRVARVLDLGCGPGQFGAMLYDKGFRQYCGVDFSNKCIERAKQNCPAFEFIVANILETDVLESRDYDCLVALEFLEHVEADLAVLRRVKAGAKFFGAVPSFPSVSHVRTFSSAAEVESRYGALFSSLRVDTFQLDAKGARFYLLEGSR